MGGITLFGVSIVSVATVVIPRLPRALAGTTLWWLGIVFGKEKLLLMLAQHSNKFDVFSVVIMSMVMLLKTPPGGRCRSSPFGVVIHVHALEFLGR